MSANRKPYQNHGFQNHSCHGGMVPPYLNLERSAQTEAFVVAPLVFDPVTENRQASVGSHEHAADIFSTDYKYLPDTWNSDCYDDAEHVAFNLCEDNQNLIYWNDPFTKGNFTQLSPSANSHTTTSVMPILQDISSPCVPLRQNQQKEELQSTKGALLIASEEKSRENHVCPMCGRTFVYQLNFAKHLTAAGCCQPPCKKSRMDPESDTKETFKSNTLPRTSRTKKITRSNSTKSRKKQTVPSLNNHPQEYLPNTVIISDLQGTPMMMLSRERFKILKATKQRPSNASGQYEAQTLFDSLQESTYCSFCDLQLNSENLYQRHRLAHALVIQLTRCLVHSLPRISSPYNETTCGSNPAVLGDWLSDQIRCSINDDNWLKLSVQEVEQVLGNSNMDVDIPQRHGIQDNAGFQNIVDLLVSQDLNLAPVSEFADATRILDFIPQETEKSIETTGMSTSVTYDPFLIQSVCSMPDQPMIVPVGSDLGTTEVASPVWQTSGIEMSDVNGCTSFCDFNEAEGSFKLLITDLDVVERQMASLLKSYETLSPSDDGGNLSHSELEFEHICNGHPQDKFAMHHTASSRAAEYPSTCKLDVELANLTSCKMLPILGDVDRLTYKLDRPVRSTTPEEEENLTH
ncbi:LOW QUALITY PROTEIN: uncharacterized protein LOC130694283 [Daphnia carinata]|uniref:LOW QUALITY PROTEIN: uncharacterized protein LOC130694283 n=1 Tax=Daphnia carinata TaxID=120202 RepID=UPI0028685C3D|nr:LOW QUALITY PROTEIN: uncharacterized protein LOC130694283 [Daphnia carinata]